MSTIMMYDTKQINDQWRFILMQIDTLRNMRESLLKLKPMAEEN